MMTTGSRLRSIVHSQSANVCLRLDCSMYRYKSLIRLCEGTIRAKVSSSFLLIVGLSGG